MLICIFSVFDSKAEAFLQPFFSQTRATGIRAFESAVNNPQELFAKHPSDFTLFEIGTFDIRTADISLHEAKLSLGTAIEFLARTDGAELRSVS